MKITTVTVTNEAYVVEYTDTSNGKYHDVRDPVYPVIKKEYFLTKEEAVKKYNALLMNNHITQLEIYLKKEI